MKAAVSIFMTLVSLIYLLITSRFHIWQKTCCFSFSVWLISLNMMISSSIHFSYKWHNFILYNWIVLHKYILCTTFSLSIPLLMGTWADSIAWLLWIVLHWTRVCSCLLHTDLAIRSAVVQQYHEAVILLVFIYTFLKLIVVLEVHRDIYKS
jgi:hypothetical protein